MKDPAELRYQNADVESVRKDQTIFLNGSAGSHAYVVLDGQVEIRINDRVVDVVSPGGIFGEMALIDERPRSGTAVARTDAKLLRVDEKRFIEHVKESPEFALKVLRIVVDRVRRADELGGLVEKSRQ